MSVTNRHNYREIPKLVALAKNTQAEGLWIKPLEIHGEELNDLIVNLQILIYDRFCG